MKLGKVNKSAFGMSAEDELALVNSYSRRELAPEEVYLFSVTLCDNDIDRDFERFTKEALIEMEKLFVGKTGIFDHEPSAKNQKARIIACKTEPAEGKITAAGDPMYRLVARAYIPRTDANKELIEAIDSGIVKEVSVGCSMGRTLCSVCGRDIRSPLCEHSKGQVYKGKLCYGELCEPRDAYEFSFVAVPAQRAAGVMKSAVKEKDMEEWYKSLEGKGEVRLSGDEAGKLRNYITELKRDSNYAKAYREELFEKVKKALRDKGVELEYEAEYGILSKLSASEARALLKALTKNEKRVKTQLFSGTEENRPGNTEFRI